MRKGYQSRVGCLIKNGALLGTKCGDDSNTEGKGVKALQKRGRILYVSKG